MDQEQKELLEKMRMQKPVAVGGRIKDVREHECLTQAEFAARIGYSQSIIGRIEASGAKVSDAVIKAVVDTFQVSEPWLRTGEGKMHPEEDERKIDRRTIGERIMSQRKIQELSQEELAKKVGCSRTQLGLIEVNKSKPSAGMVEKIAKALAVNADWLRTGRGKSGRESFTMIYEILRNDGIAREQVYEWLKRQYGKEQ